MCKLWCQTATTTTNHETNKKYQMWLSKHWQPLYRKHKIPIGFKYHRSMQETSALFAIQFAFHSVHIYIAECDWGKEKRAHGNKISPKHKDGNEIPKRMRASSGEIAHIHALIWMMCQIDSIDLIVKTVHDLPHANTWIRNSFSFWTFIKEQSQNNGITQQTSRKRKIVDKIRTNGKEYYIHDRLSAEENQEIWMRLCCIRTCRNFTSFPILWVCIITANIDIPCGGKLFFVQSSVQWPSDITFCWSGGIIWRQLGSIPVVLLNRSKGWCDGWCVCVLLLFLVVVFFSNTIFVRFRTGKGVWMFDFGIHHGWISRRRVIHRIHDCCV